MQPHMYTINAVYLQVVIQFKQSGLLTSAKNIFP